MPDFACPKCSFRIVAPAGSGGTQGRCPSCHQIVAIPADDVFDLAAKDLSHAASFDEHWYVYLADGRQHGPVSRQQVEAALRIGQIGAQAMVRRGDWASPMPVQPALAQPPPAPLMPRAQHVPAFANPGDAQPDRSLYWQQLGQNPVGTMVFGPQVGAYRSYATGDERAERQRYLNICLFSWLGVAVLTLLICVLGGTLKGGAEMGLGGLLYLLPIIFWPALFYVAGLWCFGGAMMEWDLFMNARRVRASRAFWSQEAVRKFYMGLGLLFMVPSFLVHVGLLVLTTVVVLIAETPVPETAEVVKFPRDNQGEHAMRVGPAPQDQAPPTSQPSAARLDQLARLEADRLAKQNADRQAKQESQNLDARARLGKLIDAAITERRANLNAAHQKMRTELDRSKLERREPRGTILSEYFQAYDLWRAALSKVRDEEFGKLVPSYRENVNHQQTEDSLLAELRSYYDKYKAGSAPITPRQP